MSLFVKRKRSICCNVNLLVSINVFQSTKLEICYRHNNWYFTIIHCKWVFTYKYILYLFFISHGTIACIDWGWGVENLLHNLLGDRLTVTKCHEGCQKWPKLCYVINEWPQISPQSRRLFTWLRDVSRCSLLLDSTSGSLTSRSFPFFFRRLFARRLVGFGRRHATGVENDARFRIPATKNNNPL